MAGGYVSYIESNTKSVKGSTLTTVRKIEMNYGGTIRVAYSCRMGGTVSSWVAEVYKNGTIEGSQETGSGTTNIEKYTDATVEPGDVIELKIKTASGTSYTVYNDYFHLRTETALIATDIL